MNTHIPSSQGEPQHEAHRNGEQQSLNLAVLKTVRLLTQHQADHQTAKLTFGQIYMQLVRTRQSIPPIAQCVGIVDELVREGLLISERVLGEDPAFPYTQHLISGLSPIGVACLV